MRALESSILSLPGVVGISVSNPRIVIYVESEEYITAVPRRIAGIEVETRVIGKVIALRTSVIRPVVGGISISADRDISAGTLGVVAKGVILSNAHVIAMDANFDFVNESVKIVQPGTYDGGDPNNPEHVIGHLLAYYPIVFNDANANNYLDAAIASIETDYLENQILGDGETYTVSMEPIEVSAGDIVRKSGRTTGVTYGVVDSPSTTIKIYYGNKFAVFKDAVVAKSEVFVRPGDSGSFVDKDGKFVGLLFAGSEDGSYGIICKSKYLYQIEPVVPQQVPTSTPIFAILGFLTLLSLPAIVERFKFSKDLNFKSIIYDEVK